MWGIWQACAWFSITVLICVGQEKDVCACVSAMVCHNCVFVCHVCSGKNEQPIHWSQPFCKYPQPTKMHCNYVPQLRARHTSILSSMFLPPMHGLLASCC